jgi:hypothetical protein
MAHKDWLPGGRDDVLHLTKTWLSVLPGKAALWNIPAPDSAELTSYTDSADTILQKAKSGERTEAVSAECRAAFDLLRGKLRYIKDRCLKRPLLTDADFPTLLLKPPDTHPTPAPVPSGQVQITVRYLGQHLLELRFSPLDGEARSGGEWRYAIYEGIMPHGGATLEEAAGVKHYLMSAPLSGEGLNYVMATRRSKETREYAGEESGRTAYYCARFENQRGEHGPWSPIVSAVIP